MAELEQTLNALLSDPTAMGQIMDLAGKLNLGQESPPPSLGEEEKGEPALSPPLPPLEGGLGEDTLRQVGRLMELMKTSQGVNAQATALLTALRPFLRAERQRKLDRALRMAGLSQILQELLQLWKEGELHV